MSVIDVEFTVCNAFTDSNNFGEESDSDPTEPEYLPTVNVIINKCTYVRHFGAYSGNISCPYTAAALTTIQTKRVRY